jgi:hypothetical protein
MLGYVNNGGFDYPPSGLPFDRVIENVRGARTEIVVDENSNKVLRVEFHNTRVAFRHVSQLLLLQPGFYRLTGAAKSVDLRNDRGMQWTISCADGQQLVSTDRVAGTRPWSAFDVPFEVANREGCRVQSIRLVLAARIPAEQEIGGEIWYDDLRIVRGETTAASQPDKMD